MFSLLSTGTELLYVESLGCIFACIVSVSQQNVFGIHTRRVMIDVDMIGNKFLGWNSIRDIPLSFAFSFPIFSLSARQDEETALRLGRVQLCIKGSAIIRRPAAASCIIITRLICSWQSQTYSTTSIVSFGLFIGKKTTK